MNFKCASWSEKCSIYIYIYININEKYVKDLSISTQLAQRSYSIFTDKSIKKIFSPLIKYHKDLSMLMNVVGEKLDFLVNLQEQNNTQGSHIFSKTIFHTFPIHSQY